MTNGNSEPTLADVIRRLDAIEKKVDKLDSIEKKLDTLDSRFFDFSMRFVSVNQSAFYSVALGLLSAVIAFVVARVSSGSGYTARTLGRLKDD